MPSFTYKSQFTTNFEYSQAKLSKINNNKPKLTAVYLHGLCSDPWGAKPEAIKRICLQSGLNFFRFELAGHGSDNFHYEQTDFNVWKAQVLQVIDELVSEDIILVGSSIGGWLSLVAAEERPARVKGVVGLAAAPDYQKDLYKYAFSSQQVEALERGETVKFDAGDFAYLFTSQLIKSCQDNAFLSRSLTISCPVRLFHGQQDKCVPWQRALEIAEAIPHGDVMVTLIKDANHRLGRPQDLKEVQKVLCDMGTGQ